MYLSDFRHSSKEIWWFEEYNKNGEKKLLWMIPTNPCETKREKIVTCILYYEIIINFIWFSACALCTLLAHIYMICRYILEWIKMVEKHVANIHLAIQTKNDFGKSIEDTEPWAPHRFLFEWFGFMFAGHKSR